MRVVHHILEQDGWHHSQPIRLPNLEHHDGLLNAFSRITYSKVGPIYIHVFNVGNMIWEVFQKVLQGLDLKLLFHVKKMKYFVKP